MDIVLEDVRRLVEAGAEHVSFGDPDFLNGPTHAFAIAEALHAEHPGLGYDVTAKVEHLRDPATLDRLESTGCLLITTAVESVDDRALEALDKGHDRADVEALARRFAGRTTGLAPTFVPFNPWTTREGYRDLLATIARLGLVDAVAPVQLAIRLLLPAGSRLLDHPDVKAIAGSFEAEALAHPWKHPDPAIDRLQHGVEGLVGAAGERSRTEIFARVWELAHAPGPAPSIPEAGIELPPAPRMSENWYCCAEPTRDQLEALPA